MPSHAGRLDVAAPAEHDTMTMKKGLDFSRPFFVALPQLILKVERWLVLALPVPELQALEFRAQALAFRFQGSPVGR
jgi:hypothetical protein